MYDRSESVCYWNLLLLWQFLCFYGKTMSSRVFPSLCTFKRHYLPEQFQETGDMYDECVTGHKCSIYLCMEWVSAARGQEQECSAQQIGVWTSTICGLLWRCHLHESELNQPLLEDGMARRHALMWEYGVLLEDGPVVLNVTWLPDEAYFPLCRNRNKGLAVLFVI